MTGLLTVIVFKVTTDLASGLKMGYYLMQL